MNNERLIIELNALVSYFFGKSNDALENGISSNDSVVTEQCRVEGAIWRHAAEIIGARTREILKNTDSTTTNVGSDRSQQTQFKYPSIT